jgi:hypothetical protein
LRAYERQLLAALFSRGVLVCRDDMRLVLAVRMQRLQRS